MRLEPENLLGQEGRGLRIALETLGRVRLAQVGARAVGKATHALNLMIQYARDRRQFGKPLGDFQMVQGMIADSVIEVNAARLLLHRAAWEIDQGRDARDWISMVKVHAAETLGRVTDRAVQVYGGMGSPRSCRSSGLPGLARLPDFRRHVGDPPHPGVARRAEVRRPPVRRAHLTRCLFLSETEQ